MEFYDEDNNEFIMFNEQVLQLEHSQSPFQNGNPNGIYLFWMEKTKP